MKHFKSVALLGTTFGRLLEFAPCPGHIESSPLSSQIRSMHAPKSPLRKVPPYSGAPRAYQSQVRSNTADSSANPIPVMIGQIRTAADKYNSSLSHAGDLSRYLAMLSVFYFSPKLPESVGFKDTPSHCARISN